MSNVVEPNIYQFCQFCQNNNNLDDELIAWKGGVYPLNDVPVRKDEVPQLRQRTWKVFEQAIRSALSDERFQLICTKYNFNYENAAAHNLPFRVYTVYLFAVAAGDIQEKTLKGDLSRKRPNEIRELCLRASSLAYSVRTNVPLPPVAPVNRSYEYVVQSKAYQAAQLQKSLVGIEHLTNHTHSVLQRLVMAVIRSEPDVGTLIPVPGNNGDKFDFYKVYKTIISEGLYVVALVPVSLYSTLLKLLCFGSTRMSLGQVDFFHSWRNNLEPNIGQKGYSAAQKELDALMHDPAFLKKGEKVQTCSFSLGGPILGHFLVDYYKQVSSAVFFNTPSNSSNVAEELAKKINQLPDDQDGPSLYIYRPVFIGKNEKEVGDLATYIGGPYHVGHGITHPKTTVAVIEIPIYGYPQPTEGLANCVNAHSLRYLDPCLEPTEGCRLYLGQTLVNLQLDSSKRKGNNKELQQLEEFRRTIGSKFLYHLITIMNQVLNLVFRFFGIRLLKSSV